MTTYVINRSREMLSVEIDFPNDATRLKEFIFIQSKSKAVLPSGSRVTPVFAAINAKDISINKIDGLGEPVIADQ